MRKLLLRPSRGVEYCYQPVCLWVCLSVCPRAYFWNRWPDLYKICCADPLWRWLGPPLTALRYVMYFRFYGMTLRLAVVGRAAIAAVWYRGGVWCLWMPCCYCVCRQRTRTRNDESPQIQPTTGTYCRYLVSAYDWFYRIFLVLVSC